MLDHVIHAIVQQPLREAAACQVAALAEGLGGQRETRVTGLVSLGVFPGGSVARPQELGVCSLVEGVVAVWKGCVGPANDVAVELIPQPHHHARADGEHGVGHALLHFADVEVITADPSIEQRLSLTPHIHHDKVIAGGEFAEGQFG